MIGFKYHYFQEQRVKRVTYVYENKVSKTYRAVRVFKYANGKEEVIQDHLDLKDYDISKIRKHIINNIDKLSVEDRQLK